MENVLSFSLATALGRGSHAAGNAVCNKKIDGKVYLFSSEEALEAWNKGDGKTQLAAAKKNDHAAIIKGGRSRPGR